MSQEFWNTERIAGLLLLSALLPLVAMIYLAFRGQLPSMYGLFTPIEDLNDRLPVSPWVWPIQSTYAILHLLGFGVLSIRLRDAGEPALWILAFNLYVIATALLIVEGSFYQSVNPWAAREAARSGTVPEIFNALHHWMNTSVQMAYMTFALLGVAGYGWAILRTDLLQPWVGWLAIGWSIPWLLFTLVNQTSLPAALIVMPVVMGAALLLQR